MDVQPGIVGLARPERHRKSEVMRIWALETSCPNALTRFRQFDLPVFVQDQNLAFFGHRAHEVNLAFADG